MLISYNIGIATAKEVTEQPNLTFIILVGGGRQEIKGEGKL